MAVARCCCQFHFYSVNIVLYLSNFLFGALHPRRDLNQAILWCCLCCEPCPLLHVVHNSIPSFMHLPLIIVHGTEVASTNIAEHLMTLTGKSHSEQTPQFLPFNSCCRDTLQLCSVKVITCYNLESLSITYQEPYLKNVILAN